MYHGIHVPVLEIRPGTWWEQALQLIQWLNINSGVRGCFIALPSIPLIWISNCCQKRCCWCAVCNQCCFTLHAENVFASSGFPDSPCCPGWQLMDIGKLFKLLIWFGSLEFGWTFFNLIWKASIAIVILSDPITAYLCQINRWLNTFLLRFQLFCIWYHTTVLHAHDNFYLKN